MLYRLFYLTVGFIALAGLCTQVAYAQLATATISGRIVDEQRQPLPGATVSLEGLGLGSTTDVAGRYTIKQAPAGSAVLVVQSVGFKAQHRPLQLAAGQHLQLDFTLTPSTQELTEVQVIGKTEASQTREQPITVASIDARKLQAESSDAVTVLSRVNGVRVRQSGGLGSTANLSINGLQGRAIRYYLDGVPMEYLGGGITLNNLPISQLDRIDVYKGVLPVDIGTDALGGGVNLITKRNVGSYLDVSYQVGSFNTHRPTVNALYVSKKGFFVGTNAFFNYSDNDYKIDVLNVDFDTNKQEPVRVRRFHDAYRSTYVDGSIGLRSQPWADEVKYIFSYSDVDRQIQHSIPQAILDGVLTGTPPIGEAYFKDRGTLHAISYLKTGLEQRLTVQYYGNLGQYHTQLRDSTTHLYNWFGERLSKPNTAGAELLRQPTWVQADRTTSVQRLTAKYQLTPTQLLTASDQYVYQRRQGHDPYAPLLAGQDPNTFPATVRRNVLGVSYTANWLGKKLETIVSYKYFRYSAAAINVMALQPTELPVVEYEGSRHGYNAAVKYALRPDLFVRASYENALRVPDEDELFGDFYSVRSNPSLQPERSQNYNLGLSYQRSYGNGRSLHAELNGFFRQQRNLIFLSVPPAGLGQYQNRDRARAYGSDAAVDWQPLANVILSASATYQDVRNIGSDDLANNAFDGKRVPNIPVFFFHLNPRYVRPSVFQTGDRLQAFYYYTFIEEFSFIQEGRVRNEANFIPRQQTHSLGLSYSRPQERLTATMELNNLFDARVYDNRGVQRPGRNINLKLRYRIGG